MNAATKPDDPWRWLAPVLATLVGSGAGSTVAGLTAPQRAEDRLEAVERKLDAQAVEIQGLRRDVERLLAR